MLKTDARFYLKHTILPMGLCAFSGCALNVASLGCGAVYGFTQHISDFFLNRMINRFPVNKFTDERIAKIGVPTARLFALVISIQIGARASKALQGSLEIKNAFYITVLADVVAILGAVTLKSPITKQTLKFLASNELQCIQERRRYL